MQNFVSDIRNARELMTDDWFKMGGILYRVATVDRNRDRVSIRFYRPGQDPFDNPSLVLDVHYNTKFKIYNQK